MDKNLPARPNLDHLRRQAKALLRQLAAGDAAAKRAFLQHLPAAHGRPRALDGLKLADAQSVVARQAGYASWPALTRHVGGLRALEGEWQVASLEIDGAALPAAGARILIDGDRFRTESAEATYEGVLTIDVEAAPPRLDIAFVSGPEAGHTSEGIYQLEGDTLVLCLGLVGSSRPAAFETAKGRGHALERLQRASSARPKGVTGGTPPAPGAPPERGNPEDFDQAMTPLLASLQGEWAALELATDGKTLPEHFLQHGSRTMTGNVVKVVFGGQTMVHARIRIDETQVPMAIDYLGLSGRQQGLLTRGIFEWQGEVARFLMAPSGQARPASFAEPRGTLSRWRRKT